eukprot:gnl/Hemi2/10578_TR3661_c0_g1_i1.p1 gnl/Hemi2/10578_TR3661_c0_g1~~gnl/Hemi2/10578_TR3661_c0_g1_i1.p1  ORF type:complete len:271 (-),score=47.47 gnl/Hemi2/10578_TR3661_c0_g1_i1:407-1219(-)
MPKHHKEEESSGDESCEAQIEVKKEKLVIERQDRPVCKQKRSRSRSGSRECPCRCRGPRGPRGFEGKEGKRGKRGKTGKHGHPGQDGERGPCGEKGEKGKRGKRGFAGQDGECGERGERGPCGEQGERGKTGHTGLAAFAFVSSTTASVVPPAGPIPFDKLGPADGILVTSASAAVVEKAGLYNLQFTLNPAAASGAPSVGVAVNGVLLNDTVFFGVAGNAVVGQTPLSLAAQNSVTLVNAGSAALTLSTPPTAGNVNANLFIELVKEFK